MSKLKDFFLTQQRNYGVNYWKLDGFATQQPQASTNGRYITGGKNGNYYFTEHWERWYRTLSAMYADADSRNQNLWINLTCYVNPSPWILQWSNSVWIQNSRDMWHEVVEGRDHEMDQQLSYRDDRYYTFINRQQLQFPQAHIFNHDPVYGKTGGVSPNAMTDAEFRAYLYMMATRGTAFWEMLYSYNLMDEGNKWMINAEALNFIEKNYETLRHSLYFGESPLAGKIYGYSCWQKNKANNQAEGIVSFRNPSAHAQTYTFTLNNTVGVPEDAANLTASLIMEYTGNDADSTETVTQFTDINQGKLLAYADTLTLTLQPGEIRLVRFGAKDVQAAQPFKAESTAQGEVLLQMDKPVVAQAANFELYAGNKRVAKAESVTTAADYRTLTLKFHAKLNDIKKYSVRIKGLKDWNGNITEASSPIFYFAPDSIFVRIEKPVDIREQVHLGTQKSIVGKGGFRVNFTLTTTENDTQIMRQGDEYGIYIVRGKLRFKLGALTANSEVAVNDGKPHNIQCLRENNGMIKIFVDGKLQQTVYNKNHVCEPIAAAPIILGEAKKVISLTTFEFGI